MELFDPSPFLVELREIAGLDRKLRYIETYAVVHKSLAAAGYMTPVLVGGLAVEYYTDNQYMTKDIDALLHTPNEVVDMVMTGLGFKPEGCGGWKHLSLGLFVEFPGRRSQNEDLRIHKVSIRGATIEMESIENAINTRLNYYAQDQMMDGVHVMTLLLSGQEIDENFLYSLADKEGLGDLLSGIIALTARLDWTNPPETSVLLDELFWLKNPHRKPIIEEDTEEETDGKTE